MKHWFSILTLLPTFLFAQEKLEWNKYLNTLSVQTGSGVGMYTIGIGNKDLLNKHEFDLLYGYVPSSYTGQSPFSIITLKYSYSILRSSYEKANVNWIRLGMHVNYHLGDSFHLGNFTDSRYPSNYYWWSPALRVNLFMGSSIDLKLSNENEFSFYYELGTNDLYISSYFSGGNSKVIPFHEILILGLGVKWKFDFGHSTLN